MSTMKEASQLFAFPTAFVDLFAAQLIEIWNIGRELNIFFELLNTLALVSITIAS